MRLEMNYVERFIKSKWFSKGNFYLNKSFRLKTLLLRLSLYLSKRGLSKVREDLTLMCHYLRDIVSGKYTAYHGKSLSLIVAGLVYVVSPFDFFPDLLLGGLVDDAAIVAWVIKEVAEELERYKSHRNSMQ